MLVSNPGNASLTFSTTTSSNFRALVAVFAAVDQELSDRIAKAIDAPSVMPLSVKPAADAERFQGGYGKSIL